MGTSYQNGECANGARMAVLDAGWPDTVPGVVLDVAVVRGWNPSFMVLYRSKQEMKRLSSLAAWTA